MTSPELGIKQKKQMMEMLNKKQIADELHVPVAIVSLLAEDGIAIPGGDRLQLRVYKPDANNPDSYQIDQLELKNFLQQREQVLKTGKGKQAKDTNYTNNATLVVALVGGCVLILLVILFFLGYILQWDWTGVTWTSKEHPAKTLWDWVSLLVVPVILSAAGFLIGVKIYSERKDKTDREIALDNQHETALQEYLDKMSELLLRKELLRKELCTPEPAIECVRAIAQARTWSILDRLNLDGIRKGEVIRFLHSVELINISKGNTKAIISLQGANLKGVALRWARLPDADLRGAIMTEAELREAELLNANLNRSDLCLAKLGWVKLCNAYLEQAKLGRADLHEAVLSGAHFNQATLCGADLNGADLQEADLSEADLYEANLHGANLRSANLRGASLFGADLSGIIGIEETLSLEGTNLCGVKGLGKEQLEACREKGAIITLGTETSSAVSLARGRDDRVLPQKKLLAGLPFLEYNEEPHTGTTRRTRSDRWHKLLPGGKRV